MLHGEAHQTTRPWLLRAREGLSLSGAQTSYQWKRAAWFELDTRRTVQPSRHSAGGPTLYVWKYWGPSTRVRASEDGVVSASPLL